jgi:hypothetical protein
MGIEITPYTRDWIPAVAAFNERLAEGGVPPEFRFPASDVPEWLPRLEGRRIYQEFYLAVEGAAVRGAYILKFQDFSFGGETRPLAYYHLPISEGIVNRTYAGVGVRMLQSALKAQPRLFCLGMGGLDRPLPQMLKVVGWHLQPVPFHFKVHHAARFLQQIEPLRRTARQRLVADFAALSGAGRVALGILQRRHRAGRDRSVSVEVVDRFDARVDEVWDRTRARYPPIGCRDRATLGILYPAGTRFVRLQVRRGADVVGWAVLLDTQMRGSKYFGDLRVGSIVDALAAPEDAAAVAQAADDALAERGVDLVVCNHAHGAWTAALTSRGFLAGPSNFIFAASKALQAEVPPSASPMAQPYLMRGDGDGPVNL